MNQSERLYISLGNSTARNLPWPAMAQAESTPEIPAGAKKTLRLRPHSLALLATLTLLLVHNRTFFRMTADAFPLGSSNALFHASLAIVLGCAIALPLVLLGFKRSIKPLLVLVMVCSALASYFMDQYGVPIDVDMLKSVFETDTQEVLDLLSTRLGLYLLIGGILPAVLILRVQLVTRSRAREALTKLKLSASLILLMLAAAFLSSASFASFFREHKPIRYFANPTGYLLSLVKLARTDGAPRDPHDVRPIAVDAKRSSAERPPRLVIFVVGETARADRFSLNGYARETNPSLEPLDLISYTNARALGTSTASTLPLMFSLHSNVERDVDSALAEENVLDILKRTGVEVLWRDNNSSSKGVALRVAYQDFSAAKVNPVFDLEARDVGMLNGLEAFVEQAPGDVFIVLHQMGSHGPAYHKRYPLEFERFRPVCTTSELQSCSQQELDNAYDNSILYTDYFLSEVISFLEGQTEHFQTAMFYFGDHGESLGEKGLYLHGYPYFLAPKEQLEVPAILWLDPGFGLDFQAFKQRRDEPISHANIAHTLMGLFSIESAEYLPELDLLTSK